jgi:hypothetical protein
MVMPRLEEQVNGTVGVLRTRQFHQFLSPLVWYGSDSPVGGDAAQGDSESSLAAFTPKAFRERRETFA